MTLTERNTLYHKCMKEKKEGEMRGYSVEDEGGGGGEAGRGNANKQATKNGYQPGLRTLPFF